MEDSHDPVARLEVINASPDFYHLAGAVARWDQSPAMRQRITIAEHRDVAEVQRDRVDADQHFAPLRRRGVFVPELQSSEAGEVIESKSPHQRM